jgi:hypothetical protein
MSKSGIMWLVLIIVLAAVAALLIWYGTANQANDKIMPGSDRDDHGCIPSAGYEWCEPLQKCLRPWEEECK